MVTPIIDVINPDTFSYSSSPLVRGGFNWGLHFKWESLQYRVQKFDEVTKNYLEPNREYYFSRL